MPLISATMDLVATHIRKTNFTIDAIMSCQQRRHANSIKMEDIDQEEADSDHIDVGTDEPSMPTNTTAAFAALEEQKTQHRPQNVLQTKVKIEKTSGRPNKLNGRCNWPPLNSVSCRLDNREMWDKFCEFGTEMIITRTGRRMFPTVRVSFANMEAAADPPGTKYLVLLDIVPCDNKRYRYAYHRSAWLVAGKADPPPPHRLYAHPDGPFTPDQLRKQVISFEKVKVTNNETDNTGQVAIEKASHHTHSTLCITVNK